MRYVWPLTLSVHLAYYSGLVDDDDDDENVHKIGGGMTLIRAKYFKKLRQDCRRRGCDVGGG